MSLWIDTYFWLEEVVHYELMLLLSAKKKEEKDEMKIAKSETATLALWIG